MWSKITVSHRLPGSTPAIQAEVAHRLAYSAASLIATHYVSAGHGHNTI